MDGPLEITMVGAGTEEARHNIQPLPGYTDV
jgi:hypothetical protein